MSQPYIASGLSRSLETAPEEAASDTREKTRRVPHPNSLGYPAAWYFFCRERELHRGPVAKKLLDQELVAFRGEDGTVGVLNAQCVHMGASLGNGEVVGNTLRCPLHHWCFDTDGHCTHIPAAESIPAFARQASYPTEVRHGNVYFFNRPQAQSTQPIYRLPFFPNIEPEELIAAPPFVEYVDCPWYMVGANAVDVQHFAIAHDRKMLAPPEVSYPSPHLHHTVCRFEILGGSLFDFVTRKFGGPEATLKISDWSSTMIFAHSTLARAETFGMLSLLPLSRKRTMVHITVMARRGNVGLLDPLRAAIRRPLIRRFLRSDVHRIAKTDYSPHTLIDIDQQFAEYFQWLATIPR